MTTTAARACCSEKKSNRYMYVCEWCALAPNRVIILPLPHRDPVHKELTTWHILTHHPSIYTHSMSGAVTQDNAHETRLTTDRLYQHGLPITTTRLTIFPNHDDTRFAPNSELFLKLNAMRCPGRWMYTPGWTCSGCVFLLFCAEQNACTHHHHHEGNQYNTGSPPPKIKMVKYSHQLLDPLV